MSAKLQQHNQIVVRLASLSWEGANMKTTHLLGSAAIFGLFTLGFNANGAIVSQSLTSSAGDSFLAVLDTDTSLQWLSPVATKRLSINTVLSGAGGWVPAGFRYARSNELITLLNNAGIPADPIQLSDPSGTSWTNQSDVNAMQTLVEAIGWTYVHNSPSPGNQFGQRSVYGILGDVFLGDGQSPASHQYSWFGATDTSAYASIPGGQWLYNSEDSVVGSFLVRNVQSIPEPSPAIFMLIGLLAVSGVVARGRQRR